jgi:hypothetical protein
MGDVVPGPCPFCDQWLTATEWMEGYCWNCKKELRWVGVKEDGDAGE